jgi:hypothetical protein
MSASSITFSGGARFFKADLHIHTPASKDFRDKSATPQEIVAAAIEKGLDVIAITDHNSAEWVDLVRTAAANSPLFVLPGVEVTTPACHILAIFDCSTPKTTLDDFLSAVDVTSSKRGKEEALAAQAEDVLETLRNFGGLAIAAHANSTNGLLQGAKGQYKLKLYQRDDLAALELTSEKHVQDFTLGRIPGYAAKACVQGSDAHSLSDVGQRFTFLKMDGISLRGIQQALLDYEVRVKYSWSPQISPYPQLLRVEFNQGFLEGNCFEFHPSLNCLVGGKGTGKSTVVELMRFCFNDVSSIPEIAGDNQGKVNTLLGAGGIVTVEYLDVDGERKIIEREYQEWDTDRTVRDINGNPAELWSSPTFFSQGELTRIAAIPVAQLELIDRYLDVEAENEKESQLIEALGINGSEIQNAFTRTRKIEEEIEDRETGLAVVAQTYRALEKSLRNPVLTDFPKWESENRYIEGILSGLSSLQDEFDQAVDGVDLTTNFPRLPETDSPNFELLSFVGETTESLSMSIATAKEAFRNDIEQKILGLRILVEDWEKEFAAKKAEYDRVIEGLEEQDVRRSQAKLRALGGRQDQLKQKKKELDALQESIQRLQEKRRQLLADLENARLSRFEKRSGKAAEWQAAFQGKIQIGIDYAYDRTSYLDQLKALARGSKLRETDLSSVVEQITPSSLAEMVLASNAEEISQSAGIRPESAQKLVSSLLSHDLSELLELQTAALPDHPSINYEVEDGRYKPLHELSTGGKGTVIISLALIEGQSPLVIDQPEEPLDTLAIHDQIVRTLRRQKDVRQFVFTTHNPNVAVGADSELNYILDATADRGSIRSVGGIDNEETNRLLLHHLEGGAKAFKLRSRKYRL